MLPHDSKPGPRPVFLLCAAAALLLSACASEPVVPPALPTAAALRGLSPTRAQPIDLSQPLSAASLAVIAVYSNPELIALRASEDVATAQVFAAGLYPDPGFSFGVDAPLNGNNVLSALALGLNLDFAAIARRPSAMRGAQANLDSVRFDIAWSEWLTGEQARLLARRIAYLHNIEELSAHLRQLADNEVARMLPAVSRGDLPAASLVASRLAAADAAQRNRSVELQLRGAKLELNRLLGIEPTTWLRLAPPPAPLAQLPSSEVLFQTAVAGRTDLAALRAAYEGSQAAVDDAGLGRYPLPSLGINAARDTSNIKTIGPSVPFTLPLWNRGQGDVAVAKAGRAQLRANYLARLVAIRADIAAAQATLEVTRQQWADTARELRPLQPQVEANYRAAERGDLSYAAATATAMTVLDKQIVEATLAQAIAELEIALEITVGRPLESIQ